MNPVQILLVDDQVNVVHGLKRQFRAKRLGWDVRTVDSGQAALEALAARPADLVISDMKMPGMDGGQLLAEVRRRWPATVRFVLSGQSDLPPMMAASAAIHQVFQKPCEPTALVEAIRRATTRATAVPPDDPRGRDRRTVAARTAETAAAMVDADDDALRHLAQCDVGLLAKLFQLVRSAFNGIAVPVTRLDQLLPLLGGMRRVLLGDPGHVADALEPGDPIAPAVRRLYAAASGDPLTCVGPALLLRAGLDPLDNAAEATSLALSLWSMGDLDPAAPQSTLKEAA